MRERIDRIYNPAKYASKAEKKEQLRSVEGYLKALDLDGDGLVSREEYAAAFHVMDIDGDGKLSKEEYFLGGALPFKKLDKDGDGVITFEEFQKGYDIMDKDNDGQLTRAEFMVLFREAPKVRNSVDDYLKALDLDGDGFVSREEYEAAFRVMDIDGDGKLSKEEYFLGGALPFKKLDKDGDGVITFEEFQKGYDILDKDKDGLVSRAEFMVHFKPNIMHRLTHFAESRHQKIQRLLAKTTSATILRDEMEKMDRKGVDSQTWIRAQAKELQKQLRDKNIAKQRRNVIMLGEG
jgi:Ca2+-binding EF-hand superfamily protein